MFVRSGRVRSYYGQGKPELIQARSRVAGQMEACGPRPQVSRRTSLRRSLAWLRWDFALTRIVRRLEVSQSKTKMRLFGGGQRTARKMRGQNRGAAPALAT